MLRSLVVTPGEDGQEPFAFRRNLAPEKLECALKEPRSVVWIDITDPAPDEIAWLEESLRLHPAVVSDLKREDRRPTLLIYPDYMFLSLFEPRIQLQRVRSSEVHCLIGTNYFVTVRQANTPAVDDAYERAAQNPESFQRGVAYLLYLTTQFVVDGYYPLLDQISNRLNDMEENILTGGVRISQHTIYPIKNQLITLRQMVAPQREVLSSVIGEERLAETNENRDLFRHLYERLLRVYDVIDSQRDLSSNVLDLVRSQQATRLAEAVNRLTILSMIFLPLTFLIGLFELNFVTTDPELRIPLDGAWMFLLILLITAVSASGLLWFFRRKGWL
jgi:magnesium transporter